MVIKCKHCKEEKSEEYFDYYRGRINKSCKECRKKNNQWYAEDLNGKRTKYKEFYQRNKERIAKYRSEHRLEKFYSLTKETFNTMLAIQNNQCAICGSKFENLKPCVDHDHTSGKVRGLLCRRCNLDLQVIEKKDFVIKAQNYLKSMK